MHRKLMAEVHRITAGGLSDTERTTLKEKYGECIGKTEIGVTAKFWIANSTKNI